LTVALAFGTPIPATPGRYFDLDFVAMAIALAPTLGRQTATTIVLGFFNQWLAAVGHADADSGQNYFLAMGAVIALAGDVPCLRMMLDRLWPPRKGQPVNVVMPPINTSQDVLAAIASIWRAIREGRLTPDEASALSVVVDRSIPAIELHDITKRIAARALS
jgi:hypothetical protein